MEDVHFSFPAVNISSGRVCSVLGVLDGHGGVECSRFAVEELPTQVRDRGGYATHTHTQEQKLGQAWSSGLPFIVLCC